MADKTPEEKKLTRAFERVEEDSDLRYLIANILGITGEGITPFDSNALRMAYLNGRHSVGSDLRATMERIVPKLYIKILQDDLFIKTRKPEKEENYADSVPTTDL